MERFAFSLQFSIPAGQAPGAVGSVLAEFCDGISVAQDLQGLAVMVRIHVHGFVNFQDAGPLRDSYFYQSLSTLAAREGWKRAFGMVGDERFTL